jgi:hypothetical protein
VEVMLDSRNKMQQRSQHSSRLSSVPPPNQQQDSYPWWVQSLPLQHQRLHPPSNYLCSHGQQTAPPCLQLEAQVQVHQQVRGL